MKYGYNEKLGNVPYELYDDRDPLTYLLAKEEFQLQLEAQGQTQIDKEQIGLINHKDIGKTCRNNHSYDNKEHKKCPFCAKLTQQRYVERNHERILINRRVYKEKHKDKIKTYQHEYYKNKCK